MDKKSSIKKYLGQGGFFDAFKPKNPIVTSPSTIEINGVPVTASFAKKYNGSIPQTQKAITPTKTYNVRNVNVSDDDINEASKILFAEVSNRTPDKQKFETEHIINTAINRSLSEGLDKGKSLKEVLQRRAQYQGYAPQGITSSSGKIVKSQYQRASEGLLRPDEQKKMDYIKGVLENIKNGKFKDTTGGANFYVHASDGTLWLGKTQKEALDAATKHETSKKIQKTQFGTTRGLPVSKQITLR